MKLSAIVFLLTLIHLTICLPHGRLFGLTKGVNVDSVTLSRLARGDVRVNTADMRVVGRNDQGAHSSGKWRSSDSPGVPTNQMKTVKSMTISEDLADLLRRNLRTANLTNANVILHGWHRNFRNQHKYSFNY